MLAKRFRRLCLFGLISFAEARLVRKKKTAFDPKSADSYPLNRIEVKCDVGFLHECFESIDRFGTGNDPGPRMEGPGLR